MRVRLPQLNFSMFICTDWRYWSAQENIPQINMLKTLFIAFSQLIYSLLLAVADVKDNLLVFGFETKNSQLDRRRVEMHFFRKFSRDMCKSVRDNIFSLPRIIDDTLQLVKVSLGLDYVISLLILRLAYDVCDLSRIRIHHHQIVIHSKIKLRHV